MFFTRLISGIILVVIALVTILAGNGVLAVTLCLISLIAYRELTKACNIHTEDRKGNVLELTGMVLTASYYILIYIALYRSKMNGDGMAQVYPVMMMVVAVSLIILLFVYVFTFPHYHATQVMAAMFSWLYAPVMLSFIYLIREGLDSGNYFVWLVFLCSWGSDTCAYAVGVLIGKHKMTPKLSPKKSVEGAIGGVLGAALLCVLYTYYVINANTTVTLSLVAAALLGALGAMVSMVGDLAASAIKRDHEIKDYGKLIPGHGGIMDRFDSVIITAPLIFIGLVIIGGSI